MNASLSRRTRPRFRRWELAVYTLRLAFLLITVFGFFGEYSRLADNASNFKAQLLAGSIILLALSLWKLRARCILVITLIDASYPAPVALLSGLPIDHILVSQHFHCTSFDCGPHVNSDHLPIWATLTMAK